MRLENGKTSLPSQLHQLIQRFGSYQRKIETCISDNFTKESLPSQLLYLLSKKMKLIKEKNSPAITS